MDFVKPALDGSGKAGLVAAMREEAHGVLFRVARQDLPALDKAEAVGKGYDREDAFSVFSLSSSTEVTVVTYLPRQTRLGLHPYDWYHRLCLEGARQHGLPPSCLARLEAVPAINDPEPKRPARLQALEALRSYEAKV